MYIKYVQMQLDVQKGNFMWFESNMNVYIVVVKINHMSGIRLILHSNNYKGYFS